MSAATDATLTNGAAPAVLSLVAQDPEPDDAPAPAASGDSLPVFSNWGWDETGDKPRKRGLALPDVCHELDELTEGWPRRVGKELFVPGEGYEPRFLENATELFAWLDARALVDWGGGSDMISPERFHAHLRETSHRYESVERYPHFPPIPGHYYLHPPLPHTNGDYLAHFLDFFSPQTETDRQLMEAFVLSLCWGGPPGSRPAWLFTAPEDDPQGGRGVGKSKFIELCGELVGEMLEVSPTEDIVAIKKRLLSPDARTLRLARIDNVKTYRFSWADLEGLITSPVISGHRLFKGEGRRPNTLTWALTLNGASLSKDLAKRTIVVVLERPAYSPSWEQQVRDYVDEFRWHILNDARLALES
jgi:hypothetical protein